MVNPVLCYFPESGCKVHLVDNEKKMKQNYNIGQNKWEIWTTPPPHFNDAKMARFCSFAPSSLLWEGWGIIVSFYSVQDWSDLLICNCYCKHKRYIETLLNGRLIIRKHLMENIFQVIVLLTSNVVSGEAGPGGVDRNFTLFRSSFKVFSNWYYLPCKSHLISIFWEMNLCIF